MINYRKLLHQTTTRQGRKPVH